MKKKDNSGAGREEAPIVLYTTPDGAVKVNVLFCDGNLWLPQAGIAELFGVSVSNTSRHLKNIFESGELVENSVVAKIAITEFSLAVIAWSVVSKLEITDIWCDTSFGGAVVKQYFTTDSVRGTRVCSPLQGEFSISEKVENSGIRGNELLSAA